VFSDAGPADAGLVRSLGADVIVNRGPNVAGGVRGRLVLTF